MTTEFNLSEKELGLTETERDEIYFETLERNPKTNEELMNIKEAIYSLSVRQWLIIISLWFSGFCMGLSF